MAGKMGEGWKQHIIYEFHRLLTDTIVSFTRCSHFVS